MSGFGARQRVLNASTNPSAIPPTENAKAPSPPPISPRPRRPSRPARRRRSRPRSQVANFERDSSSAAAGGGSESQRNLGSSIPDQAPLIGRPPGARSHGLGDDARQSQVLGLVRIHPVLGGGPQETAAR